MNKYPYPGHSEDKLECIKTMNHRLSQFSNIFKKFPNGDILSLTHLRTQGIRDEFESSGLLSQGKLICAETDKETFDKIQNQKLDRDLFTVKNYDFFQVAQNYDGSIIGLDFDSMGQITPSMLLLLKEAIERNNICPLFFLRFTYTARSSYGKLFRDRAENEFSLYLSENYMLLDHLRLNYKNRQSMITSQWIAMKPQEIII